MGREIRMVPPNWEHPRRECPHSPWAGGCEEAKEHGGLCYQPMYDNDFDTALSEWLVGYNLWKEHKHPDQQKDYVDDDTAYWDWCGTPPDPNYYHQKFDDATWYQVYETVSEGTPVTPPFATREELINYLVQCGDFWDQRRGDGGWERKNAEYFVNSGYAPSLMAFCSEQGVELFTPRDGMPEIERGIDECK